MSGAFLETWIVVELLKSYWHVGRQPPFYYYRDKDQREIDLLLIQDGVAYPLEIKKTASPSRDDVRHFAMLERLGLRIGPGGSDLPGRATIAAQRHNPIHPGMVDLTGAGHWSFEHHVRSHHGKRNLSLQ